MIDAEMYGLDSPVQLDSAAGGDQSVSIVPGAGCASELIECFAWHDDTVDRVIVFYLDDGITQVPLQRAKSAGYAGLDVVSVYSIDPGIDRTRNDWRKTLWLTPSMCLTVIGFGLAVGKRVHVRAVLRTLRGVV
jgi:hypothetical protein